MGGEEERGGRRGRMERREWERPKYVLVSTHIFSTYSEVQ